jgi:hypothetical protein
MANPRPAGRMRPLKLTNAAPQQTLKNAILENFQKLSESLYSRKTMTVTPVAGEKSPQMEHV